MGEQAPVCVCVCSFCTYIMRSIRLVICARIRMYLYEFNGRSSTSEMNARICECGWSIHTSLSIICLQLLHMWLIVSIYGTVYSPVFCSLLPHHHFGAHSSFFFAFNSFVRLFRILFFSSSFTLRLAAFSIDFYETKITTESIEL